ncbi:MAG TPA: apolipoprotein N-acyltransferase [Actinomycetota bacterium]|nr:apolipoprotein N-acyltransferase [Actinomycetota bacterium]
MTPRREFVVVLAAGIALSFAFPEADLAPLAWIALVPLLVCATGAGWSRGMALAGVFAVGFFGTLLVWVSIVGWVAWGALVILEGVFIAGFGAVYGGLSGRLSGPGRIALAATAWMVFEYLRAHVPVVGFPWGALAQSQHNLWWMLRVAGIGGTVLLGGVVVAVNACIVEAWRTRSLWYSTAGAALLLAGFVIPGPASGGTPVTVALVQGNVPDRPPSLEKDLQILDSHVHTTEQLDRPVDLVVWPESSVAIDPDEPVVAEQIATAAQAVDAPMIVGGNEPDESGDHYLVEAFEVAPDGSIVDRYQKTHLVPFGEYVPARRFLDWIPMLSQVPYDALPGDVGKTFNVAGGDVAPVISFEGDFGSLVRGRIAAGGRLLVVATNTSTWGHSWASAQHVAFSQLRAAENGVWTVHAALSGISAFIDPSGRVVSSLGLYRTGSLTHDVTFVPRVTVYARLGDLVPGVVVLVGIVVVVADLRRRARVPSPDV